MHGSRGFKIQPARCAQLLFVFFAPPAPCAAILGWRSIVSFQSVSGVACGGMVLLIDGGIVPQENHLVHMLRLMVL